MSKFIHPVVGEVYILHPGPRSSEIEPYLVRVVQVDNLGFYTELVEPEKFDNPHIRRFVYSYPEWEHYHKKRFKKATEC